MTIRQAVPADAAAVGALAACLWPSHTADEMAAEFSQILAQKGSAVFLAADGKEDVGFAQCGLRHDYVEGTSGGPVGYLEGIFVSPAYRRSGVAANLTAACEHWAKSMGCREFASDCALENAESIAFHRGLGFAEVNRIVCFVKPLR